MGDPRLNFDSISIGWMDYWLKGEENGFLDDLPRIQYYTLGLNQWQTPENWPPDGMEMKTLLLSSTGHANTLHGDGVLVGKPGKTGAPDLFIFDPSDPVPSLGANICCTGGAIQPGYFDQRKIEEREDVLVYTSGPLKKGIEVSSSNFPRFERNLNTGGRNYVENEGVVATNRIHHSADYPSQIRLPVIGR